MEESYESDEILLFEIDLPSGKRAKRQFEKELKITIYQVVFVLSSFFFDMLEIRITLSRLNPPRLLVSQFIQYLSMELVFLLKVFFTSYAPHKMAIKETIKLSPISAATLTLIDISADTAAKIALLLAPHEKIESIFGFLSLLQTIVSFFAFTTPFNSLSLLAVSVQTVGYIFVSSTAVGRSYEPTMQDKYQFFGLNPRVAGYMFAIFSVILRCLNLTMTQMMSSSVHFTATSFCQGNGTWGLIITSIYHFFIYYTQKEKIVFLTQPEKIYQSFTLFIIASALKNYTAFWLILHTNAVEYTRVDMMANLMKFAIRHIVFREDGATYGYTKIPTTGILFTILGFTLLCLSPTGSNNHEVIYMR